MEKSAIPSTQTQILYCFILTSTDQEEYCFPKERKMKGPFIVLEIKYFMDNYNDFILWIKASKKDELLNIPEIEIGL